MKRIWMVGVLAAVMLSCETKQDTLVSGLNKADFVSEKDGKPTALYALRNANGMEVCITNFGGQIVSIMAPGRDGKLVDVILGYDSITPYIRRGSTYGALIGRYGNRIAKGRFTLDGTEYHLPQNNNGNCLHGGPQGFNTQVWDAVQKDDHTLELKYLSADGEAGFPGALDVKVTYTLTDDNAIDILYEATTDKATVVNMTNHSYFNLSGIPGSQILDHIVMINADAYTPVDSLMIPYAVEPVEGTPFDLRMPQPVGKNIDDPFEQMVKGHGYDHNFVLNTRGDVAQLAAKVVSPVSGIGLELYTNEPGVQFYTSNFMRDKGKHGAVYTNHSALCLETQHYPDSPNHPEFPSTTLRPGEKYVSKCIYKFTVEK